MKPVYLAHDAAAAELVRKLLEDAGIRAAVAGATLGAAVGAIPFTSAFPTILVPEEDLAQAAELIRTSGIESPRRCPNCGYDLRGLPEARCPECGQPYPRREAGPPWTCPACGESLEGQFTACWSCGAERPAPGGQ